MPLYTGEGAESRIREREEESREATAPKGVGPTGERQLRRGIGEPVPTSKFPPEKPGAAAKISRSMTPFAATVGTR